MAGWRYYCVQCKRQRVIAKGRKCARCNPPKYRYKASPEQQERNRQRDKARQKKRRASAGIPSIWGTV